MHQISIRKLEAVTNDNVEKFFMETLDLIT